MKTVSNASPRSRIQPELTGGENQLDFRRCRTISDGWNWNGALGSNVPNNYSNGLNNRDNAS